MSPDFILGNLKHNCIDVEQTKEACLGGGMKVLFGLPKGYSSLLLISQNRILEYTWVPSSRRHKQALATAPTTPFRQHYCHIDTNLAIFMILAWDSLEDKDYLCYELLIHCRFWTINFLPVSLHLNMRNKGSTWHKLIHRPEEGLNLKSECIFNWLVPWCTYSRNKTLVHQ